MKQVSKKQAQEYYKRISYAHGVNSLNQVYKKPSYAKQCAFTRCLNLCRQLDGHDFCIPTHNTDTFTAGFKFHDDNNRLCVCYITYANTYYGIVEW